MLLFIILLTQISATSRAQERHRLRIYLDCLNADCDFDYVRQQITLADFVNDRTESDVHILVSFQVAGNAGNKYFIRLIGQGEYNHLQDTLSFFQISNSSYNELRIQMVKFIKAGLIPYLMRSGQQFKSVNIEFLPSEDRSSDSGSRDKWNYWVFQIGGRASFSGDKNYKENSWGGRFTASRVTEKSKLQLEFFNSTSRNSYMIEEAAQKKFIHTTNDYIYSNAALIKSLSSRWSLSTEFGLRKSTYDNIAGKMIASAGLEYNIYPYKLSSNKFLVIRYLLMADNRRYIEETIFAKMKETLYANELGIYASFTQAWGSISSYVSWYNYLHDISKNNLSIHANVELQLFKGFSLSFYADASIIKDQLNLGKGGATSEEVLLRLKALSTNYNYYTGIGLTYRFGSSLNNFVNPRFTNGRY